MTSASQFSHSTTGVEKEVDERERERELESPKDENLYSLLPTLLRARGMEGRGIYTVHLAIVRQWSLPSSSLEEDSVGQKTKVSGGSYAEETSPGLRIAYFLWSRTLWEILRIHFGSRQASHVGLTEYFEQNLYFVPN